MRRKERQIEFRDRLSAVSCRLEVREGAVNGASAFPLPPSPFPTRSALTLIELLIVIIILTTLVSAAIPILAPTNDDRRLREASRIVNAFISGAQMKAIRLQRPYGVMIKRLSQDTNANGAPGSKHDDNAVSVELLYVEQPTPFVGFDETSSVRVSLDLDPTAPPGQGIVQFVRRGNDTADDLPDGWDYDLFPPATIRRGDVVEVGGTRHELIEDGLGFIDDLGFYFPNSGEPYGTYVTRPINDTGQVIPAVVPDPTYSERFWTHPMPYKILRQPMPTSAEPLQLPDATAIDLRASGVGINDYFYVPDFNDNKEPIVIMFAPEGRVSRVVFSQLPIDGNEPAKFDQPVVDNVFLLVGRRELAPPPAPDVDPTLDEAKLPAKTSDAYQEAREAVNWLRGESRWIGIGSQSGRVVTVENGFVEPQTVIDESGGFTGEELRNRQLQKSREFARQMSQLGGR